MILPSPEVTIALLLKSIRKVAPFDIRFDQLEKKNKIKLKHN